MSNRLFATLRCFFPAATLLSVALAPCSSFALDPGDFVGVTGFPCGAGFADSVVAIDPATGDRSIVSGGDPSGGGCATVGVGPPFEFLTSVDEDLGGLFLVGDNGGSAAPRIFEVDPVSGDRSVFSGCDGSLVFPTGCTGTVFGAGPELGHLGDLEVIGPGEAAASPALSSNEGDVVGEAGVEGCFGSDSVMLFDRTTGDRSVLSGSDGACATAGSGDVFSDIETFSLGSDGTLWVGDGDGEAAARVMKVDAATGDRTVVSGCDQVTGSSCTGSQRGTGPLLSFVKGIRQPSPPAGPLFVLTSFDCLRGTILSIDPVTGDRTVFSGADPDAGCAMVGAGPAFGEGWGLALAPDGAFLVSEREIGRLLRVDPVTGARSLVTGCTDLEDDGLSCDPSAAVVGTGPEFSSLSSPIVVLVPEPGLGQTRFAALLVLAATAMARRRA